MSVCRLTPLQSDITVIRAAVLSDDGSVYLLTPPSLLIQSVHSVPRLSFADIHHALPMAAPARRRRSPRSLFVSFQLKRYVAASRRRSGRMQHGTLYLPACTPPTGRGDRILSMDG